MNRILKRPMFRRGGSADGGITSGLRPGYEDGLGVNSPEFASKMERLKKRGIIAKYGALDDGTTFEHLKK